MQLISPTFSDFKIWGTLSYITKEDRDRVIDMPANERKVYMNQLELQIKKQRIGIRRGDL